MITKRSGGNADRDAELGVARERFEPASILAAVEMRWNTRRIPVLTQLLNEASSTNTS